MPYVLLHHKVTDYEDFKAVFDDDAKRRRQGGCKGGRLFRSAENPNDLVAIFEWDDLDRARKFATSFELREAIEWATVVDVWTAEVFEEVAEVEA